MTNSITNTTANGITDNRALYASGDLRGILAVLAPCSKTIQMATKRFGAFAGLSILTGGGHLLTGINYKTDDFKKGCSISRGCLEIAGGVCRVSSLIAETSAKTATVASKALGLVGVITSICSLGALTARCTKDLINIKKLEDHIDPNKPNIQHLEIEKITHDLQLEGELGLDDNKAKLKAKKTEAGVVIGICTASIVAGVVGIVCTGGLGLLIYNAVATIAMTGLDFYSLIQHLKQTHEFTKAELVRNILLIIAAGMATILAVYFAPTVAIGVASAVIGALIIAPPAMSVGWQTYKEHNPPKKTGDLALA